MKNKVIRFIQIIIITMTIMMFGSDILAYLFKIAEDVIVGSTGRPTRFTISQTAGVLNVPAFIINRAPKILGGLTPPDGKAINAGPHQFSANVQDDDNTYLTGKLYIDGNEVAVGGVGSTATPVLLGINYSLSSFTEGWHTWKMQVTDGIEEVWSNSNEFLLDKTLPNIGLLPNGSSNYVKNIDTLLSITDNLTNIVFAKSLWSTSASEPSIIEYDTNVYNNSVVSSPVNVTGNYYLHVIATDDAGNTRKICSNVYKLDNTAPLITSIQQGPWSNIQVIMSIDNIIENEAGINRVQWKKGVYNILNFGTGTDLDLVSKQFAATENGDYTIFTEDVLGNRKVYTTTVTRIDKVKPVGNMNINNNATYALSRNVMIYNNMSDDASGLHKMTYSLDNINWGAEQDYSVTSPFTLPDLDGTYTIYAKYKDLAGNETTDTISDSIMLDRQAPYNCSIEIGGGAQFTNNKSVVLSLSATDATSGMGRVRLSNDGVYWTELDYAQLINWNLANGSDGIRTVYAQFRDLAGNWNPTIYSDTIQLDTIKPTGSILIDNGEPLTYSRNVTLNVSYNDNLSGVVTMIITDAEGSLSVIPLPGSPGTVNWVLPSGSGTKVVSMILIDAAGNISDSYIDDIYLESFNVTSVKILNVVDPSVYDASNPFVPKEVNTSDFTPENVLAGAEVAFGCEVSAPSGPNFEDTVSYELTDNNDLVILSGDMDVVGTNKYSKTVVIPDDFPIGGDLKLKISVKRKMTVYPYKEGIETFPVDGSYVKVFHVYDSIFNVVRFNQIK